MASIKKIMEKIEHQKKVNPGNKTSYQQPPRPRSAVFSLKTKYNRANNKKIIMEAKNDY